MSKLVTHCLSLFLVHVLVLYPIVYFGWNWLVVAAGHASYVIPGFWIGMAGYFIIRIIVWTIK